MERTLDYQQIASDIVWLVGGPKNISSLGHCMTRPRFILKDESKADTAAIKEMDVVLGVVAAGGQYMVILGKNLLPVYEAAQKSFDLTAGKVTDENVDQKKEKQPVTPKNVVMSVLGYISAAVTPMTAGLVAGGILKVALLLITLVSADFSATTTYTILSGVADACFYFMPIFVAYGAAQTQDSAVG